jgi:hypothetical protein
MSHKKGRINGALPHAITIATMAVSGSCTNLDAIDPVGVTEPRRGTLTSVNSIPHPPAAPQDAAYTGPTRCLSIRLVDSV